MKMPPPQLSVPYLHSPVRTVSKLELVTEISNATGQTHAQTANILKCFIKNVTEALVEGNEVTLRNFGTFKPALRRARKGRQPGISNTEMSIPERVVLIFEPGKDLREKVAMLLSPVKEEGGQ